MKTLEDVYACEYLGIATIWEPGTYHAECALKCSHPELRVEGFPLLTKTEVCRICPRWNKRKPE